MNTLLLQPTDVLFFRDGRPMSGSLSGHGAAWPLPTVTNAALHAALHRAQIPEVHVHVPGRSSDERDYSVENRNANGRIFGSLHTAGPFPVSPSGAWLFPRPLDACELGSIVVTHGPLTEFARDLSSLPEPLLYPVANQAEPNKEMPATWWTASAWLQYLTGNKQDGVCFHKDSDFSDTEQNIGIGIDPDTATQDKKRFYSAHYLRLRPDWKLGLFAEAMDKRKEDPSQKHDLIPILLDTEKHLLVGGQQRLCSAEIQANLPLAMPIGMSDGFAEHGGKCLVKWVLLTPAIFPKIGEHSGGWLPSWVDKQGEVQLLDGPGKNFAKRHGQREGMRIHAKLVAALVGKPIPVTGYALATKENNGAGPKSTYLAVPAGSVYYFECTNSDEAKKLATALNWQGDTQGTSIKNRRSTLMGEKGFGLGACSTWHPHSI
jgi:CRISPR-associated protein Cmr3